MKKILVSLLAALLCGGCAETSSLLNALDLTTAEQPAPKGFGNMGRFMGRTFVEGTTVMAVSTPDNGNTMVLGDFSFRYTLSGKLEASNPLLEKVTASISPDGALLVEGENWDTAYKYRFEPNEYGGFNEKSESKSLAGINFLSSYEFRDHRTFVPYTVENARAQAASKAYRDRERAQNAIEERAAKRESDQNMARAFNAGLGSLAASSAQQAQDNAQRNAMLANINAQANAQRQAQAAEAQRRAADQQRDTLERNARWKADKEQAAAQHQQAMANAQADRASQRATQQREEQERRNRQQAEARERTQQQQRQAQADAQLRLQDQQREARAQAQQKVYEQQRNAAAQKAEQPVRRYDSVANTTSGVSDGGKDLNCLTEGHCRKACPAHDKQQPTLLRDCLSACSRRSSCKVSYQ